MVKACQSFYFVDQPGVYHYFYNPKSISKSFRAERWESCKGLIHYCERDFSNCEEYDFSTELVYLRWFCVMLALNERHYFSAYSDRKDYCAKVLSDPETDFESVDYSIFDVSSKLKIMMRMIQKKKAGLLALL